MSDELRNLMQQLSGGRSRPDDAVVDLKARALALLKRHMSDVLKLAPGRMEANAPLEDYGLDSLMAVRITRLLEETLGSLPKTLFFEFRTLDELAAWLADQHPAALAESGNGAAPAVRPRLRANRLARRPSTPPTPAARAPRPQRPEIAIVGVAGRYPGADDLDTFWENLARGRDCVTEIPADRWDRHAQTSPSSTSWGGFLSDVARFDADFFNISPREARLMDPQERLFLECVYHVLEDAGAPALAGGRVGVFVGVMYHEYQLYGVQETPDGRPLALSGNAATIANRVSYVFDFKGPSMAVDTMCSSSLTAIHLACASLLRGDCDAAVAGGVNLSLHPNKYLTLGQGNFASKSGRCQAFGAGADGYVPGEGVGAVLLKPLAQAEADGDRILAVIQASAVNHGGRTNGYTVPNPRAQAEVISRALSQAGVDPRTVTYVEAHGTGTALGDPIEIEGLARAFQQSFPLDEERRSCFIGSVKSNIGHCESAAGIAALTKVLLCMRHGELVPTLHADDVNPHIDFSRTPFTLCRERQPWEGPRRAGISSFGAGGANAHLIVDAYKTTVPEPAPTGPVAVVLSAPTAERLDDRVRQLLASLEHLQEGDLARLAFTLQTAREAMAERLGFVADSLGALRASLQGWLLREPADGVHRGRATREQAELFTDSDMAVTLDHWLRDGAPGRLGPLLTLWVQGAPLDWKRLHPRPLARLDLPLYPFAGERHWVSSAGAVAAPSLHPMLGVLVPDLEGPRFSVSFTGSESFLADHRVQGRCVLPAVAYLEMARAAVALCAAGEQFGLHDVVWARPLVVGGSARVEVRLRMEEGDRILVEVLRDDEVLCWGTAILTSPEAAPAREVGVRPHDEMVDVDAVYARLEAGGLVYGPTHRCIRGLRRQGARVLADLETPDLGPYGLPPGLLDGALQALSSLADAEAGAHLPFALDALRIHGPCVARMTAVVEAGPHGYDIDVCTPQGEVRVSLRGLSTRAARPAPLTDDGTVLLVPHWVEAAAVRGTAPSRREVVGCGIDAPGVVLWREDYAAYAVALFEHLQALLKGGGREGLRIQVVVPDHWSFEGLAGLLKSLVHEHPEVRCQWIAVSPDQSDLDALLAAEALCGDVEVRWRDGRREVRAWREETSRRTRPPWKDGGVYLVTGGVGGLGRIMAEEIATRVRQPRLLLVGRSPLDDGDARLQSLRAQGAEVRYRALDVADGAAVSALVSEVVADWGTIDGVLHAAGVLRDGWLLRKTAAHLSEVLAPKVSGLLNLDAATRALALDCFVVFASASGAWGNAGQSDYAAANAFMDAFAAHSGGRVRSVDWPLWEDGGMTVPPAAVARMRETVGLVPLSRAVALDALYRVLATAHPQVMPLAGDAARLRSAFLGRSDTAPETVPSQADDATVALLKARLSAVVGTPVDRIDAHRPLIDYGVDSVMMLEMTVALERDFGPLPKTLLFEHENLARLGRWLQQHHGPRLAAMSAPPRPPVATPVQRRRPRPARSSEPPSGRLEIAIIGMAGRYPQAPDLATFWDNLAAGRDCITEIPTGRWPQRFYPDPTCRWGGFLDGIDMFDPLFFNISPAEAEILDPQERLFLETAWHALEDAGYTRRPQDEEGQRVGVFVGVMHNEYQLYGVEESMRGRPLALSSYASSIANRVSYVCNFRGPCMAVDTMCSSSLTALHLACHSLRRGECGMALVGGVNLSLHPNKYRMLTQGRFAASDGRCAAFGEGGDGYVPGEGVGAVLLKPLRQAVDDGDAIYGVIQATALNHGGRTHGYSVPNPRAQAEVIGEAWRQAGIDPRRLGYLEAHGTGTALGDPIEIAGLTHGLDPFTAERGFCPIGSVKSNIGHLEGAAGIAALTKLLLCMRHGQLVPTLHAERLNPHIDFAATPFVVQREAAPWAPSPDGPRVGALSSFGAGGSNAHVIVEEAPHRPARPVSDAPCRIVLSARTPAQLREVAARLAAALIDPPGSLEDIAYTLQVGREPMAERLAFMCSSVAELRHALHAFATGGVAAPPRDPLLADWLRGQDVDWSSCYKEGHPNRVHLPGHPFARMRCWAPRDVVPSPLAADHQVAGQAVLPAAAILDRVREGLQQASGHAAASLHDVVWRRPLLDFEGVGVRLAGGDGFELACGDEVYCRGRFASGAPHPGPALEVEQLREACPETLQPESFYAAFSQMGIDYGPSLRSVAHLQRGAERALARLVVPEGADEHRWPVLVDGAFQACLALIDARAGGAAGMVFSLSRLDLHGPLAPAMWATVEKTPTGYAFALYDDEGTLRLRGDGLSFRAPRAEPRAIASPAPAVRAEAPAPGSLLPLLAAKVCEVLKLPAVALEPDVPLVDYGLDSIAGVDLVDAINAALSVELPVTALFEHNTLAQLEAHLQGQRPAAARPVAVPAAPRDAATQLGPIAIVGMSGRFAKSPDLDALWAHLAAGDDLVEPVKRWDLPGCHGSFLDDIEAFDARFFRISAVEAAHMDPQQRVFLEECWRALEGAGYAGVEERRRWGVFAGVHENDYERLFEGPLPAQAVWGNMAAVIPSRIAYFLDMQGPTMAVDTACSSSLVAVHLACQSLWSGEVDVALAGGVAIRCTPALWENGVGAGMVSPSGRCYTFDARADGFVPGEGAGVVVLKRLQDAQADGDHVHAVIRGSGINQDGATNGITAPSAAAQERLEAEVYRRFAVPVESIGLVEAHGSATPLGDPIEVEALTRAFRRGTDKTGYCALGSIKANLGHTVAAAGIAGLLKAVLSLSHRQIPPAVHFEQLNPRVPLQGSPFRVNTRLEAWSAPADGPRLAAVSSFGASGTNAHVVLEEAPPRHRESRRHEALLVLSARSPEQLRQQADRLADFCRRHPHTDCLDMSLTLLQGRRPHPHRLACVASSATEVADLLGVWLADASTGEAATRLWSGTAATQAPPHGGHDLASAARAWVAGAAVAVEDVLGGQTAGRIPLPTYPFARTPYWVSEMGTSASLETSAHASTGAVGEALKSLVAEVSGFPVSAIDLDEPTEAYGLDSLMISHMNDALGRRFPDVSRTLFFEHPTLGGVARHLEHTWPAACAAWTGTAVAVSAPQQRARKSQVAPRLSSSVTTREPVAIIGISGRYPGARDLRAFWDLLREGRSGISEIPPERWPLDGFFHPDAEEAAATGRSYSRWGGFIEGFSEFDPLFFNISPAEALSMDPQERLFLQCCWEALEDAAWAPGRGDRRVGVFVGVTKQGLSLHSVDAWRQGSRVYPRTSFGSIANRVSYLLDLQGPSMPIDTQCSSSLTAVHEACEHLHRGECTMAIAGGVNLYLHPLTYVELCTQQMLSPDGVCRSFGKGANGFVPGEGVGAVVLKPLSRAEADGDPIYAVIRGSAINHDGKTNGYTVPNPGAQARLIREALERAGLRAADVGCIEAHGTGTALGDPIEVTGLTQAFAPDALPPAACALGSVKSNIGHLEAAAGIAGLTKIVLQLRHRILAPTLHASEPNANIDFARTPFALVGEARPWEADGPRVAGLSSFGAGGANAHVLVQAHVEPEEAAAAGPVRPDGTAAAAGPVVIVLSARDRDRLREQAARLADHLRREPVDLVALACTLQVGRVAMAERLAFVAGSLSEVVEKLDGWLEAPEGASGVHQGRARSRGALSALTAEEDMVPLLARWLASGQHGRVAELWVEGAAFDWAALSPARPRRLHLPTYPFARNRFWNPPPAPAHGLHPLLGENVSDIRGVRFVTRLVGSEFFLADHRVAGRPVLAGAALLEMAREVVSRALPGGQGRAVALRDVVFLRLVEGAPLALEVSVSARPDGSVAFVVRQGEDACCEGIGALDTPSAGVVTLERTGDELSGEALYARFHQAGVEYGPSQRAVVRLWTSAERVVADLALPAGVPLERFVLHPSLLDGALQAVMGFHAQGSARPVVPYALDRLEVLGPCHDRMLAVLRPAGELTYDIDLADSGGRLCARLRGLTCRAVQGPRSPEGPGDRRWGVAAELLLPVWEPLEMTPVAPRETVLLVGPEGVEGISHVGVTDQDTADDITRRLQTLHPAPAHLLFVAPPTGTAVRTFFRAVKAMLALGWDQRPLDLTVFTRQTQDVLPGEAVDATQAGLHGLVGSLTAEVPAWRTRLVDLPAGEALPEAWLDLPADRSGATWAWRDGQWFRRVALPLDWPAGGEGEGFRQGGRYLIVGGAGGLGRTLTEYLQRRYQAHLAWLGRRPHDAAMDGLLDTLPVRPEYHAADARDLSAMEALARQLGPLDGVVHSALVLADQTLAAMSEARFLDAYQAQAEVARTLGRAFTPRLLLFFSSMIAFTRGPGQANYAAGCTYKDALARQLSTSMPGTAVKVMNWGWWGSVGAVASPDYQARMAAQGMRSIEPAEGMPALERLLCGPFDQLGLVKTTRPIDVPQRLAWLGPVSNVAAAAPAEAPSGAAAPPLDARHGSPSAARHAVARLLGVDADALDSEVTLEELGLDPVQRHRLANELGLPALPSDQPLCALHVLPAGDELPLTAGDRAANETFEALLASLLCAQLQRMGVQHRDAIPERHPGWAARSGEILGVAGLLAPDGRLLATDASWASLERHPSAAQARLAEAALRALPDVLAGTVRPVEVLFPEGSPALVEGVYRANRLSDLFNRALADAVAERLAGRRAICVLEIGAGTGSTTGALLARLPSIGEYVFTDVSSSFFSPAQGRHPALRCQLLDITRPVSEQGFEAGRYDLVVAANVLHATPDVRRAVAHAKALLRPGGLLALNEMSRGSVFTHLTFGLLDGWWRVEDAALRLPGCPALAPEGWARVLAHAGFGEVAFPARSAHDFGQQVIVAVSDGVIRVPATPPAARPAAKPRNEPPVASPTTPSSVEVRLRALAAAALGMDPHAMDPGEPLESYGLDSIMVVGLTNSLRTLVPDLKTSAVFEHRTLDSLVTHLLPRVPAYVAGEATPRVPSASAPVDSPSTAPAVRAPQPAGFGEVAVIGLAGRYPRARNVRELWQRLAGGESCIREIPTERWDWRPYYDARKGVRGALSTRWGGFLDDVDAFDPLFFHISPAEAEDMDPQERLFLQEAHAAIEDAGYTPQSLPRRLGVFVGVMNGTYRLGSDYWSIANRVSWQLDFSGPSMAVDSACSSSLTAIHLALESLANGTCECAIAGGVNLILTPTHMLKLSAMTMLSGDDRTRPFGAEADGFVDGEGVGAVLLKPLTRALEDGDHIYGVLRASMVNAGGKTHGYTVPNPIAQAEVVRQALERAGVRASEIGYVEAHGTGTSLGDPIEIAGLARAFAADHVAPGSCAIGSVKANIGHLESAAGIAGLTKVLLQMGAGQRVPSLHADPPNPEIDFAATPFVVQKMLAPWPSPRIAGVSSFGAGGANAHLVVAEHVDTRPRSADGGPALVLLSARDEERLAEQVTDLREALASRTDLRLSEVAYTLQVGREAREVRLAVVAASLDDLVERLATGRGVMRGRAARPGPLQDPRSLSLETLACRWVDGERFDWARLHEDARPRRVSLPTYPFARERYWAPGTPQASSALHPLLHRNTSTLGGQRFASIFNGHEAFLQDHLVDGVALLSAAATIEMARVAAALSLEADAFEVTLRDLSWERPLVVTEEIAIDVAVGADHDFRIEGGGLVYCSGHFAARFTERPPGLDLDALRRACPDRRAGDACYREFGRLGLTYGPSHQGLQEVLLGETQALARLAIPFPPAGFAVAPGLLDSALQAGLCLLGQGSPRGGGAMLPVALDSVTFFTDPGSQGWALVTLLDAQADSCRLAVDLCDIDGQVAVRLEGLQCRSTRRPARVAAPRTDGGATDGPLLEALARLLAGALKMAPDRIDPRTPLEDYGFSSIMAVTLTREFERTLGPLPPTLFFEFQDLAGLAAWLQAHHPDRLGALTQARASEPASSERPRALSGRPAATTAIAIVGLAGRYPDAPDIHRFWENLRDGRDSIREIPPERWDRRAWDDQTYARWGGFLDGVDRFDARFFGISPNEAEVMDPQERLFLECAWDTLEDAGCTRSALGRSVGVFVGVMYQEYQLYGPAAKRALSGNISSVANRVSYFFDFQGPSLAVDTMCSSSLTAIHLACASLIRGECEAALAGGVNLSLHPNKYLLLGQARFASTHGRCKAFGEGGDGYVPGEGVGAVLLKPLGKALQDGDAIYGVIRGSALNHGGKTNGYTVPNPSAQAAVIERVYRAAGIDPRQVTCLEAHGTGTSLGDPIEVSALARAFGHFTDERGFCSLGSVKSNIGHCESAAGIAGLTKLLMQMRHGQLAPTLHVERANPHIDFDATPFVLQRALTDWTARPRIAAISSFGAGGSNAHLVIEEQGSTRDHVAETDERALVLLSARTPEQLRRRVEDLLEALELRPCALADLAWTLRVGREPMTERLALWASSLDDLRTRLQAFLRVPETRLVERGRARRQGPPPAGVGAARLWVEGHAVDLPEASPRLRVHLPGYPFAGERFWAPDAARPAVRHPLLHEGERGHYRSVFTGEEPFLADHRVGGRRLLPAVAYLEMARAAAALERPGARLDLVDVSFVRPLEVEEETEVTLHLEADGRFTIRSAAGMHCRGRVVPATADGASGLDLAPPPGPSHDVGEFYRGLEAQGLAYGPSHRVLASLRGGPHEVLARLELTHAAGVFLEPGLLDGALQAGAALGGPGGLPSTLARLEIHGPLTSPSWVRAREGLIEVADAEGRVAVRFVGLQTRRPQTVLLTAPAWAEGVPAGQAPAIATEFVVAGVSGVAGRVLDGDFERAALSLLEILAEKQRSGGHVLLQLVVPAGSLLVALSGMLKSAALENPRLMAQLIEVEPGQDLVEVLAHNAGCPGDRHVRYHEGRRQVAILEEVRAGPQAGGPNARWPRIPWRDGGVYLVTGGAGGLGRIFAREMQSSVASPVVVLAGRSTRDPGIEGTEYCSVDLGDEAAVTALVDDIRRRHGALHGIVHAAGVVRDSFVLRKTAAEVAEVFGPKVSGLRALDLATAGEPLDFFILFSSAAAVAGSVGQADYAAANAFMDAFAVHRNREVAAGRRRGLTLSVNWPQWKDGGMRVAAALEAALAERWGMVPLTTASGVRALYQAWASGRDQVMVAEGDVPRMRRAFLGDAHAPTPASTLDDRPAEEVVAEVVARVTGRRPEDVDLDEPLDAFGLNSIMALEAVEHLSRRYGALSQTIFFEHETLRELIERLPAASAAATPAQTAPPVRPSEASDSDLLARFTRGELSLDEALDEMESWP